jgi:hypothetical protein
MGIVAVHTIVYGKGQTAEPGSLFDPGAELSAELLASGAAREPTEIESAAWALTEAAKAPQEKKSAKALKAEQEAAAKAEQEAAAKAAEENLL